MKLVFSVLDRCDLWPQFKAHYEAQGITEFICVSYGPKIPGTKHIESQIPASKFNGYVHADVHNRVVKNHIKIGEWFIVADLDEFSVIPGISLQQATEQADIDGATFIQGLFSDRLTIDGSFPAQLQDNIWEQFPICTDITSSINKGACAKIVAIKGPMPVCAGHHDLDKSLISKTSYVPSTMCPWVHHFKWWGVNPCEFFWGRGNEKDCRQTYYRQELVRMIKHLNDNNGKFNAESFRQLNTIRAKTWQT